MLQPRTVLRPLLLASAVALLTACGSDSDPAPTGSATGVLTDSPIGGVQYTTSSGLSGVTNHDGHFKYNPGDKVTFKIGGLTLGTIKATGSDAVVTPLLIAESLTGLSDAERQNVVTNLLVLFQSLDSDGDPGNGISIPTAVRTELSAAVAATLDFKATPTTFVANSTLTGLVATAGGTLVDPEAALEHFRIQFLRDLAGVYYVESGNDIIAFRFDADGYYLMGEVGEQDESGRSGMERGQIAWNPQTGQVTTLSVTQDTNGEWGLSHPLEGEKIYFSRSGSSLIVRVDDGNPATEDETFSLRRLEPTLGIQGPWTLWTTGLGYGGAYNFGVQQFLFLPSGRYLMIDPVGDDDYSDPDDPKCGDAGVEYGRYTLSSGVLTFSNIIADTNDCAGAHDSDTGLYESFSPVSFANSGAQLIVDDYKLMIRPGFAPIL